MLTAASICSLHNKECDFHNVTWTVDSPNSDGIKSKIKKHFEDRVFLKVWEICRLWMLHNTNSNIPTCLQTMPFLAFQSLFAH